MSDLSTEAESEEQNNSLLFKLVDTSKQYDIEGIPLKLYVLLAVLSVAILQLDLLVQSSPVIVLFVLLAQMNNYLSISWKI